jgi:hypothetical protein
MNREEQIEQALKRIRELKDTTGFKEIEDYLLSNKSEQYFFNEVDADNKLVDTETIFKKYVLKSTSRSGFIKPQELNKERLLFKEVYKLITEFLGNDYLLIVFIDNNSRYRTDEDVELFNLIFKKTFSLNKIGCIKTKKIETCEKLITIGEVKNFDDNKTSIDVDLIYKSNLTYTGNSIQSENVLFYGYNIEENPYLVELFKNSSPNKILNIIPLCSNNSFFDNVD